jgi:uncharacterized protein (DUF1501 family)
VVIILRGAMDGLDVVQPRGDAGLCRAAPDAGRRAGDLDGFFTCMTGLSG